MGGIGVGMTAERHAGGRGRAEQMEEFAATEIHDGGPSG